MSNTIDNTGKLYFQQAIASAPPPPPTETGAAEAPPEPVITRDMFVQGQVIPGVPTEPDAAAAIFDVFDRDGNGMSEAEFLEYYHTQGRGSEMHQLLDAGMLYNDAKGKVDTLNREIAAAASQLDPTATDEERQAFVEWYKQQPEYQAAAAELEAATATLEQEFLQGQAILAEVFTTPGDPLAMLLATNRHQFMEAMTDLAEAGKPGLVTGFMEKLLASPNLDPGYASLLTDEVLAPALQAQVALQATETGDVEAAIAEAEALLDRVVATYGAPEKAPEVYDKLTKFRDGLKAMRGEVARIDPAKADEALGVVGGFRERFKAFGTFGDGMTVLGTTLAGIKLQDAMQNGDYAQALVEASGMAPDVAGFAAKLTRVMGKGGASKAITRAMPLVSLIAGSMSLVKNLHDGKLLAAMGDALILASPVLGPWSAVVGIGLNVVAAVLERDEPEYMKEAREDYARYLEEMGVSPEAAEAFAEADRESAERLMRYAGLSAEQIKMLTEAGVNLLDPEHTDFYHTTLTAMFASPGGAVDSAAAYAFLSGIADAVAAGTFPPEHLRAAMEEASIEVQAARDVLASRGQTPPYSAEVWRDALAERKAYSPYQDNADTMLLLDLLMATSA